jgi:hypothetical protein
MNEIGKWIICLIVMLGIVFSLTMVVGTYHYKELEMAKLGFCEIADSRGYTHWAKCPK